MTVAIVAEYNPFHTGHKFQIDEIRREFGNDTKIIAIMSGNFTQRGEPAVADKFKRAEWACLSGVDLVLELPFPYSMSSGELFARAAISIIDSIKVVDCVSFGSESGNIESLTTIAENMMSEKFQKKLAYLSGSKEYSNLGYPTLAAEAYKLAYSSSLPKDYLGSNNILAIEYIKAIKASNSPLKIHTVRRVGADYSDSEINNLTHASAMGIRKAILNGNKECLSFIPEQMRDSFSEALKNGDIPSSEDKLSSAVISYFRLNSRDTDNEIFDAGGGLYNRLRNSSFDADTISSLIAHSMTKKFTTSRIRRSVYYSFFGVTSSSVKELPEYTQVLAFNEKESALLKSIKERSGISVLTKPSRLSSLSESARMQKELSDKADSVYQLTLPKHRSGAYDLVSKPFVKK